MKTEKKIKLYISTFGSKCDWIKRGTPIEVGAANRDNFVYPLKDDTGINISKDNPYWGELTGLYWIWKNVKFEENDIIGFGHYNKILDISVKKIKSVIGGGKYHGIVLKPVKIVRHSFPEDIKIIRDVIRSCYPNYYDAWIQLYDEDGSSKIENCSNCELFYLGQREFEAYCEFLFGVLFKVRSIIGDVNRPPYHKRYCAFLGERLLSVYLLANKLDVTYAYMLIYRIFPLNIVRRVFRLFGFSRTPAYLNLRKRLNKNRIRRSSWR